MRKIVSALAMAMMMTLPLSAQEAGGQDQRRPDRSEMVKRRTEMMVSRYGLNETQAQQLLELNTKYADAMGPGQRGPRPGFRPGQGGQNGTPNDSVRANRRQRADNGQRPEARRQRGERPDSVGQRPNAPREMPQEMKEYEAGLQQIMTDEQYKAYQADMEQMRQRGPRGQQRGPRGQQAPQQ